MANREGRGTERGDLPWRYREIMEEGSEELKAIIALITCGKPVGVPLKEEEEDEAD